MSQTIDDRVVQLTFDNQQFEKGVQQSLTTLDKLDKSLDLKNGSKGLENIAQAADHVDLRSLQEGVDALNKKFGVTGTIGRTVLQEITKGALGLAQSGLKKLTSGFTSVFNQIEKGGATRAKNIAQAKFQLKGLGIEWDGVVDTVVTQLTEAEKAEQNAGKFVETIAKDIDYAVKDTAYGLDSAAKAASQLSASQVQIGDDMRRALRGISGVAAMTNSEYDEIANIFTTVAGNGKLMTQQMNQLSYKGLNVAATLAKAFNESEEMSSWFFDSYAEHSKKTTEAISRDAEISEQAVRTLVTNGGIDFEHFARAMDESFGEHAKDANNTFTGALDNMNAALSRIGAEFAGPLYNNLIQPLNELREVFNAVKSTIQPAIDAFNELEFVVMAKISKFLDGVESTIKAFGLDGGPFQVLADVIHNFTATIGGDELAILDKVRASMEEGAKTSDVIEKANEVLREITKSEKNAETETLSLDDAIAKVIGTTKTATAAGGEYSKSAEEMHDAIQRVWKENPGKSWEERSRIFTEEGFSEAEIAEIQAVVNEMKSSGRTVSSQIDEVYNEVDATLDKTKTSVTRTLTDCRNELAKLGKDGHVDLNKRPIIDADELNKAGYDAGKGFATVFSSTFSNEAGDVAINFTPILTDENGNYTGVMSSSDLEKYAEEVIAGVHDDYLNLQMGGTFTGSDAIDQAEAAANRIHELHEEMIDNYGDDTVKNINDISDAMSNAAKPLGDYTHSAEEMRDAIQGIWSEKQGLSWDERTRILTEQGFSKDEIKEIQTVVNEMKKSGRTLSSDIDEVYAEVDSTIDKSTDNTKENIDELSREETRYLKQQQQHSEESVSGFEKIKHNITGFVCDIGSAFQNVFLNKGEKKPFENMSIAEKIFSGIFNVIKVGGKAAGAVLGWIGTQAQNLWKKITESKFGDWVKEKFDNLLKSMNELSLEKIQEKFEKFKKSITESKPYQTLKSKLDQIKSFFKDFDLVSTIQEGLKNFSWDNLVAKFEELKKDIEENGLWNTIKAKWDELVEYFQTHSIFDIISQTFTDFQNSDTYKTLEGYVNSIKEWFSGLFGGGEAEEIEDGGSKVSTALASVESAAGSADSALGKVQSVLGQVKETALAVWSKVSPLLSGLTTDEGIMGFLHGLEAVGVVKVLFSLKNMFKSFSKVGESGSKAIDTVSTSFTGAIGNFGKAILNFGGIGTSISKTIEEVGGSLAAVNKSTAREGNSKAIRNVAIAIGILAASLWLLSKVPQNDLIKAGVALAAIAGGVVVLTLALTAFLNARARLAEARSQGYDSDGILAPLHDGIEAFGKGINKMGTAAIIVSVAVAVLAFVAAIAILKKVIEGYAAMDDGTFEKGGARVAAIFGALALGIALIGASCKGAVGMLGVAPALIAFVGALAAMLVIIKLYSIMDDKTFEKGGKRAAMVLGAMVAAVILLGNTLRGVKAGSLLGASAVILTLTVAIAVMSAAMLALSLIPEGKILKIAGGLAIIIGALTLGIGLMGKMLKGVDFKTMLATAAVIMSLAVAVGVLTVAVVALSLIPFDMLKKGLIVAAAMLLGLTLAVRAIATSLKGVSAGNMLGAAATIVAITLAMVVLTGALIALSLIPTKRLNAATMSLGAIMLVLSRVAKSASDLDAGAGAAFLGMAAVIGVIAYSLYQLSSIKPENLAGATLAIGALMGVMAIFAKASSGSGAAMASIAMMALMLVGIGGVLYTLANYGDVDKYMPIVKSISLLVVALSGSIALLGALPMGAGAAAAANILMFVGIFAAVGGILAAIDHFRGGKATAGIEKAGDMLGKLGEMLGKFIGGIVSGALSKINEVPQDALDKIVGFIDKIASIEIPVQSEFKWDANGISFVDQSLATFATGMKGICEAVNSLEFTEEDAALLPDKQKYFTAIGDFVEQIAGITIPTQTEFKWDATGISYVDTSLGTFAKGMQGVVTAANAVQFDESDVALLPEKKQYFDDIVGFTQGLASIPIPTQTTTRLTLLEGYEHVDTSLEKFAMGMEGVVSAVNHIEFNPITAMLLGPKLSYMQGIAEFVQGLAAVPVPQQIEKHISLLGGYEKIDTSLETFAKGMQGVVTAVNALQWNPFTATTLDLKLTYMTGIANFVSDLAGIKVPVQAEVSRKWGEFNGVDQSLQTFAEGMQGVVTAANSVDLGVGNILGFAAKYLEFQLVAGFVRDLAAIDIPTQTEVSEKWSIFGKASEVKDSSLVSFATGMSAVSEALNGMVKPTITESDVQTMANCVAHMAEAASGIPEWNEGITKWFADNSLSGFATEMALAAPEIQKASANSTGINLTSLSSMAGAITQINEVIKAIKADGHTGAEAYSDDVTLVGEYATLVRSIGEAFSSFDGLQNVTVESIQNIPSILTALADVSSSLDELETSGMGPFKTKENPFATLLSYVEQLGSISVDVSNITALATAMETLSSESVAKFASGFDDTSGQVSTAVDSLVQNAVTAITESSSNTEEAFKTAGTAFLEALAAGMEDTSGVETTSSGSGGAQALVEQMANSITSDANKEIFKSAGAGFLSSLAEGMSDTSSVSAPAADIVTSIYNAIVLQRTILLGAGKSLINSLSKGFTDKVDSFVEEAKVAARKAKAGAATYENAFYSVGSNMGLGLKNGIGSWAQSIASEAARVVREALAAARREGEIGSPSKKMIEIGKFLDMGLAIGLNKYAKLSNNAAADVANNIIDTVDTVLDIHSPSKVMYKKGKQTVQGYAYGVDKNGKILVKSTQKAAQKALNAQKKSDKKGEAQRVANQKAALEKQLAQTKKGDKKQQQLLKSQINALTKLQSDYGKVAAKGTAGLTQSQIKAQKAAEEAAKKEKARLDGIVDAGSKRIEQEERNRQRSLTALEKQNIWKEQLKKLTKGTSQYNDVANKIADLNREVANEQLEAFEKTRSDLAERQEVALGDELRYWKSKVKVFKNGSEAYNKLQDKIRSLNNQIYKNLNDAEKSTTDNIKNTYESLLERIDEIWKQYEDDIKSRGESLRDTAGLFDFFEAGTYETSDTLIENLRSQVKGLEDFQNSMDKIRARAEKGGLDDVEGFLDQLENLGPSANANLQNLIDMTDAQWQEYIDLYNRRSSEAMAEARKDINISEYNKQAQEAVDDVNKSLKELTKSYYDNVTELGINIVEPSISVGANMVNGMIKGIVENEKTLTDKVAEIAKATMATAKATLGIASPSRKFAIFGMQMDLGMVQGLAAYQDKVNAASAAVGDDAIQAMQEAIDKVDFIGNSDYDFNPVITPVLDDSQIIEGLGYIQQLMNQQESLQMVPNYQTQGLFAATQQQIQNGLVSDALNRIAGLVTANGGSVQISNEFNITSNNPREVAEEVSRILDKQVRQEERAWA